MFGNTQRLDSTPRLTPSSVSFIHTRLPEDPPTISMADLDDEVNSGEFRPRVVAKKAPLLPIALESRERLPESIDIPLPTPKLQRRHCNKASSIMAEVPTVDPYASPCAGVHYVPPVPPPRGRGEDRIPNATDPRPLPSRVQLSDLPSEVVEGPRRPITLRCRPTPTASSWHPGSAFDQRCLPWQRMLAA